MRILFVSFPLHVYLKKKQFITRRRYDKKLFSFVSFANDAIVNYSTKLHLSSQLLNTKPGDVM